MALNTNFRVFIAAFGFVIIFGLLLQWFILPMTPWYAVHGLMTGGDWVQFHLQAIELAHRIRNEGWSVWVARFEGQAPASVAAAIYAITGIEHPSVLLPVHGILYGITALSLYSIATGLGFSWRAAWLVLLPLFIFPSTAMIWGQIHKDIYSLAGILLVLRFWIHNGLVLPQRVQPTMVRSFVELILVSIGMLLIVFVRPYLGQVVLVASLLILILQMSMLAMAMRSRNVGLTKRKTFHFLCLISAGLAAQMTVVIQLGGDDSEGAASSDGVKSPTCQTWHNSLYLPKILDKNLASLACARDHFRTGYPNARSNIDIGVEFTSAKDVLKYIPRALQISLMAPFPNHWFDDIAQPRGQVLHMLVIPEMIVLYLALLGILLAFLKLRTRKLTLIIFGFSLSIVLVYALVITNVGTLYRMRYPAMLLWIALGVLGWSEWSNNKKIK